MSNYDNRTVWEMDMEQRNEERLELEKLRRFAEIIRNNVYFDVMGIDTDGYDIAVNGFIRSFSFEEHDLVKEIMGE